MKDYKSMVDAVVNGYSDLLNEWECGFIDDMYGLSSYDCLSENQKEKIREIHKKYVEE